MSERATPPPPSPDTTPPLTSSSSAPSIAEPDAAAAASMLFPTPIRKFRRHSHSSVDHILGQASAAPGSLSRSRASGPGRPTHTHPLPYPGAHAHAHSQSPRFFSQHAPPGTHSYVNKYLPGGSDFIGVSPMYAVGSSSASASPLVAPSSPPPPPDMSPGEFRIMASKMSKEELTELCVQLMEQQGAHAAAAAHASTVAAAAEARAAQAQAHPHPHPHAHHSPNEPPSPLLKTASPPHLDSPLSSGSASDRPLLLKQASGHVAPSTVMEFTELISSGMGSEQLVRRVVMALRKLLHADQCNFLSLSQDSKHLVCAASSEPEMVNRLIDLNGVAGVVFYSTQSVNIPDVKSDWRHHDTDTRAGLDDIGNALLCPVRDESGKCIGVLECLNHRSSSHSHSKRRDRPLKPFSQNHLNLIKSIAGLMGVSLVRTNTQHQLEKLRRQNAALNKIAEISSSDVSLDRVVRRICNASATLVHSEMINLWLVEENRRRLRLFTTHQVATDEPRYVDIGDGFSGHVASTGRLLLLQNVSREWCFGEDKIDSWFGFTTANVLAVPVTDYLGKTMAVIEARNKRPTAEDAASRRAASTKLDGASSAAPGGGTSPPLPAATDSDGDSDTSSAHSRSSSRNQLSMGAFTDDDKQLLQNLAMSAASMLRQQQLLDKILEAHNKKEALGRITDLMSAEVGTEKVIRQLIDASYTLVKAERISFFLVQKKLPPGQPRPHMVVSQTGTEQMSLVPSEDDDDFLFYSTGEVPPVPEADDEDEEDSKDESTDESDAPHVFERVRSQGDLDPSAEDSDTSVASTQSVPGKKKKKKGRRGKRSPEKRQTVNVAALQHAQREHRRQGSGMRRSFSASQGMRLTVTDATGATRKPAVSPLAADISTVGPLDELADELTDSARDEADKELVCRVSLDKSFVGTRIPWGSGIVGDVAMRGRLLNIRDAYDDPRFDGDVDHKTNFTTRAILTVPVKDRRGRPLAVIQAINKQDGGIFDEDDERNLLSLASSAGIILRKSMLFERAVAEHRKSHALLELLKVSSRKHASLSEVIDGIVSVAYDVLNADRVTIFFADHGEGKLYSTVSKDAQGWSINFGQGIAGTVAQTGETVKVDDAYHHPKFDKSFDQRSHYRTKSVLCTAVKDPNEPPMAVIQALNKKRPGSSRGPTIFKPGTPIPEDYFIPFTAEDAVLLNAFCVQLRTTLRRYKADALLAQLPVDDSARSLIDLYSSRQALPGETRFKAHISLQRVTADNEPMPSQAFAWPELPVDSSIGSQLSQLEGTDLHVFDFSPDELLTFTLYIFEEMNVLEEFDIPVDKLKNFVLAVRSKYNENPFHNWFHGFSVFHFSYLAYKTTHAKDHLLPVDALSLLIASLCHDIDHPGNTNTFEINSESQRALIYNDNAVLENHHAFTTFTILREDACNIFVNHDLTKRMAIRTNMIEAILATDMTAHFQACRKLSEREDHTQFDVDNPRDRQELVNTLIHSSDLSGQVFPLRTAREWESRISTEFHNQAQHETELGLTVAPFMQGMDDEEIRAGLQVKFIDFVLMPWWENVARLLPGLRKHVDVLNRNRAFYDHVSMGKTPDEAIELIDKPQSDGAAHDDDVDVDVDVDVDSDSDISDGFED